MKIDIRADLLEETVSFWAHTSATSNIPPPLSGNGALSMLTEAVPLSADLVLRGGRIITMKEDDAYTSAVAVRDGRIASVGSDHDVEKYVQASTRVIELKGRVVLPGFIDTHLHLVEYAEFLEQLDLTDVKSITELKSRLKQKALELLGEEWIIGRGWDQEKLSERRYPTKSDLDDVVSDHPVILKRVCGHIGVANSLALFRAGISKGKEPPRGGIIDVGDDNEPTGIVKEAALDLILDSIPQPVLDSLIPMLKRACADASSKGITSAHCILLGKAELSIRAFRVLKESGELPLRIRLYVPEENIGDIGLLRQELGVEDDLLKIVGVKFFMDGSLGARTAALHSAYSDDPGNTGELLHTTEEVLELIRQADKNNLQPIIHCIGDRALDTALDGIESASKEVTERLRVRIEHASVLPKESIRRMAKLRVIASVQPRFVVSDFWIESRLGAERVKNAYPFRSMVREGIMVSGSSDCPVEPLDPIEGIWAAITRDERNIAESLAIHDAIRLYTSTPPHTSFDEDELGTIEVGKQADMVVLSENPFQFTPHEIRRIKVLMTIVGGKVVYDSGVLQDPLVEESSERLAQ